MVHGKKTMKTRANGILWPVSFLPGLSVEMCGCFRTGMSET